MTAHELLVAARNRIDLVGWHKGGFSPDDDFGLDGPRCAWGSCMNVSDSTDSEAFRGAREAVTAVLRTLPNWEFSEGWGALAGYNDEPSTTKQDVLDLFDRAIAATAPEPYVALEAEVVV